MLPIGCFGLLVVGGVGAIARQPYGLYLLAAGSAALIASATRSTWTLLLFGRTNPLDGSPLVRAGFARRRESLIPAGTSGQYQ